MDITNFLVILIPYDENQKIEKQNYEIGNRDHREFCKEIIKKYNMEHTNGEGHLDFAETFNKNGYAVIFSSGAKVNGKFFASVFLPEKLSIFQINFFENCQNCFSQNYHELVNFFSTLVYSPNNLTYNSGYKNYRSLEIEALIDNNLNKKNGQILLNEEIAKRKEEVLKR